MNIFATYILTLWMEISQSEVLHHFFAISFALPELL
jgi:hypothetical protein